MHILHQCIIVMIYDDADYIRLIYTVNVTFKIWQNSFMVDRLPIYISIEVTEIYVFCLSSI
jgi:hypothetical protein